MAVLTASIAKHATLSISTVDTVTLSGISSEVQVYNRGTGFIYFTVDGSVPTVAGDDTYVAVTGGVTKVGINVNDNTVIKLISAAALPYSVVLS